MTFADQFDSVARRYGLAGESLEMAWSHAKQSKEARAIYNTLWGEPKLPAHVGKMVRKPVKSTIRRNARQILEDMRDGI